MKVCSKCGTQKNLDEFYFQKKRRASGEEYLYYQPYCKECAVKKSVIWQEKNYERYRRVKSNRWQEKSDEIREYRREYYRNNKDKEMEYLKFWQENNKDKVYEYGVNKRHHDITDFEWLECLEYFNFSCAYCGMTESQHLRIFSTKLHKEHVIHDGNDYIDNCVPACKSCNGSKHDFDFKNWYNKENPTYTKERERRIVKWMTKDSLLI